MGYRTFRDSKGTEWQAWDVVPQLTERREIERRVRMAPVEHADRRRQPDRRVRCTESPQHFADQSLARHPGWIPCWPCRTAYVCS